MIFITLPIISRITALSSGPTMARTHPSPGSRPRSRSVWRMENATGEDHDYYHCHVHDHVRYHYPIVMFFLTFTFIIIVIRTIIRRIIMIIAVCLCIYDWNDSNAMPNLHLHDSLLVGSGKKISNLLIFCAHNTFVCITTITILFKMPKKYLDKQQDLKISALGHPRIAAAKRVHASVFLRIPAGWWPWPTKRIEGETYPSFEWDVNDVKISYENPWSNRFFSQVDKLQLHHLRNIDTKGKGYYKGS